MSAQNALTDEEHRRNHPRLRLGITARLDTLGGPRTVRLIDLSRTGAKLLLPENEPVGAGVLTWLDYEAFGESVWQDRGLIGMSFDAPLSLEIVTRTRHLAPTVVRSENESTSRAARAWATGRYNSGTER